MMGNVQNTIIKPRKTKKDKKIIFRTSVQFSNISNGVVHGGYPEVGGLSLRGLSEKGGLSKINLQIRGKYRTLLRLPYIYPWAFLIFTMFSLNLPFP